MSLLLHRVTHSEKNTDKQIFLFSLEQIQKFKNEVKSVEEEFNYGGQIWKLVVSMKDLYFGIFLKLVNLSAHITVKCKFSTSILNKYIKDEIFFFTDQVFPNKQVLIGKTQVIHCDTLSDPSNGFLDSSGKRTLIAIKMHECRTLFQTIMNTSTKNHIKKNPNGIFFDSQVFNFANHQWYLRFYLKKLNSNNLPAVYLYLKDGSPYSVTLQIQFILFLSNQTTELLNYDFGDGAKYDGFGKTLSKCLDNENYSNEIKLGVEIFSLCVYKFVSISVYKSPCTFAQDNQQASFSTRYPLSSRSGSPYHSSSFRSSPHRIFHLSQASNEILQDHYGNQWKLSLEKETVTSSNFNLSFDKGIQHYANNHTIIVSILCHVMSRNLNISEDLHSNKGDILTAYFSNYTNDKGHLLSFPLNLTQLTSDSNKYLNENEEIMVRIDFISIQQTIFPERSGPKYDVFLSQIICFRQEIFDKNSQPVIENGKRMSLSKKPFFKIDECSFDKTITIEEGHASLSDFFKQTLKNLSQNINGSQKIREKKNINNSKNDTKKLFLKYDEFMDEILLMQISALDGIIEEIHKERVSTIVTVVKLMIPFKLNEVHIDGSLGDDTASSTRCDARVVFFCEDLPSENYHVWSPSVLKTISDILNKKLDEDDFISITIALNVIEVLSKEGLEVTIMFSGILDNKNDINFFQNVTMYKSMTTIDFEMYKVELELAACHLKKRFYNEISSQAKSYIKVVKCWRDSVHWQEPSYSPNDYLLSLLTFKSYQLSESKSLFKVLQKLNSLVQEPELKIYWKDFYNEDEYKITWNPPSPLVRDPVNPVINVAATLKYWGQFRKELVEWLTKMKLNLY